MQDLTRHSSCTVWYYTCLPRCW